MGFLIRSSLRWSFWCIICSFLLIGVCSDSTYHSCFKHARTSLNAPFLPTTKILLFISLQIKTFLFSQENILKKQSHTTEELKFLRAIFTLKWTKGKHMTYVEWGGIDRINSRGKKIVNSVGNWPMETTFNYPAGCWAVTSFYNTVLKLRSTLDQFPKFPQKFFPEQKIQVKYKAFIFILKVK